ncbi:XPC-binding domain containing protein [Novymonas esmeraldas]|uniref:XPC-binding domain containing protein n=1 Tax=Novymonas esmeraldas TaxID=1808958 RepID=A0AAW0F536_9TRYP
MSGPPPASGVPVMLRSIAGKSALLTPPVTLAAVLKAATTPPFSFAPETVKIHLHGRLVHLQQYQRQHGGDLSTILLHPSAYTSSREMETASARDVATPATPSSSSATAAANARTMAAATSRTVILYGVPQRVGARAGLSATSAAQRPGHAVLSTGPVGRSPATLHGGVPGTTSTGVSASGQASSQTRTPAATPPARASVAGAGPLPYPHSPDGLRELGVVCATGNLDPNDDDLIAILQGAPQPIYDHPTMQFISSRVRGDLVVLQAVMEQIAQVSPAFFNWIVAYPQKFLNALNRGGDRPLQQMREQLRMLAMRAMAEQLSGEAPSRHVMMLEVNARDGSPDVFQVEVQVGDFSDASGSSESCMTPSLEESNTGEDDDDGTDGGDDEEGSGSSSSGSCSVDTDEEEAEEMSIAAFTDDGATATATATATAAEEEEEEREPHRGAIVLPATTCTPAPWPAPPSLRPPSGEVTRTMLPYGGRGSGATAGSRRVADASPPPPTASAPVVRRSLPPLPPTSSAAGLPVTRDEDDTAEDARLARLREEVHRVDVLIQQWTDQATSEAAALTHAAVMALRRDIFAVLNDRVAAAAAANTTASLSRAGGDVRRLAVLACRVFSSAEEFYTQLDEQGVRSAVFGEAPQDSVAAWAAVAALSHLLVCDVDAAVEQHLQQQQREEEEKERLQHESQGPRRIGALRSLQPTSAIWSCPALRWATAEGPERLMVALLRLCRQQRTVLLWYSSHYVVKAVGKTIQTMAYVMGGTEEAQQTVSLQRLKLTSKAHKQDEVADCMVTLGAAVAETGAVPDAMRRQWFSLMRGRYQQFVLPLEKDLPTPHMTSNPLYVCDTRHVQPPKHVAGRPDAVVRGVGSPDTAARWWAGYCDDRHTCCADKWCTATTSRLWNAVAAMENLAAAAAAESVAVVLTGDQDQPRRTSATPVEASVRGWLSSTPWMPVEAVAVPSAAASAAAAAATTTTSRPVARHSAVLCEQVVAAEGARDESPTAHDGFAPLFSGDLHIVDSVTTSTAPGLVLRVAGGAAVPTYVATVVRNFVLPASPRESIFLRHLFGMFAKHPRIPVAAAVRDAALANARSQDAPWLVGEYVLCDYGGPVSVFADARARADAAPASAGSEASRRSESAAAADVPSPMGKADEFVRMPCVPLGQRLSIPRPLPPTQGRPVRATLRRPHAPALALPGEVEKRQYARTHAIDELYEMMLGSLLEHQPTGEADVLDHLMHYVEASQDTMHARVRERKAEVAAPDHGVAPRGRGSLPKPHLPNGKRGSFTRRKQ